MRICCALAIRRGTHRKMKVLAPSTARVAHREDIARYGETEAVWFGDVFSNLFKVLDNLIRLLLEVLCDLRDELRERQYATRARGGLLVIEYVRTERAENSAAIALELGEGLLNLREYDRQALLVEFGMIEEILQPRDGGLVEGSLDLDADAEEIGVGACHSGPYFVRNGLVLEPVDDILV